MWDLNKKILDYFFKTNILYFSLAENMSYVCWWPPNTLDRPTGSDSRVHKKITCHIRPSYLFNWILFIWPLQRLYILKWEGANGQTGSGRGSALPALCLQWWLWTWQPEWGQMCTIFLTMPYPHVSTSSYFQPRGVTDPFMVCLSNDLLRSPVCCVNLLHPQCCLTRNAIWALHCTESIYTAWSNSSRQHLKE